MRYKFTELVAVLIVVVNLLVIVRVYVTFRQDDNTSPVTAKQTTTKNPTRHASKLITVIIREFETYENDISLTVQSFISIFPNIQVVILYDEVPYPPLDILGYNSSLKNVRGVNLRPRLKVAFGDSHPLMQIRTKYVLFVPDAARISSKQLVQTMLQEVMQGASEMVAAPFAGRGALGCLRVNINTKEWSLKYSQIKGEQVKSGCDAVGGKHVVLLETELLRRLSDAFLSPFPQALYIQTAALNVKVKIMKAVTFQEGKPLLRSHHAQWKHKQIQADRLKQLYKQFQIKQVVRETGTTEWYGCTRDTPRCFGPVIDSMPSYLFEGKWTPPCCLSNLRKTAKHVFNNLEEAGIRYWLEAGSLLGAMRSGDILPWDHDVDVGFNRDDLNRSPWLKKAKDQKPVVDTKGFLWEKATEGNFFRVHYSKTNKMHVNLFPFYCRNGTMVRDSWFTTHRNMEFPDNFLHPMSSIEFIGRQVPSPNNIRDFLELKFGRGAIENPEYPDPGRLPFP